MTPSEQDLLIAEQVRTDQLRLLFRQSLLAVFGSFAAACILVWLEWGSGDRRLLTVWLLLLGASSVLRLAMFLAYARTGEAERIPARWERVYWVTLVLSAGIWGAGALALVAQGDLQTQAITLFFAVGMAGSAVATYSAYRSMTLTAIGLVLLPCTLWVLVQPSSTQRGLALAALLFSVAVVRATRELSGALETALRLTHEMERAHSIASQAAQTDVLTGLNNRRAFYERAEQLFAYCQRHQRALCALILDIDHFKQVNDRFGHHAGDEVLRHVGALLTATFRGSDLCGRIGGEEFVVLLTDMSGEAARLKAEEVCRAVADLPWAQLGDPMPCITASLGGSEMRAEGHDLQTLLHRADQAMYRAKAAGRNQVVMAD